MIRTIISLVLLACLLAPGARAQATADQLNKLSLESLTATPPRGAGGGYAPTRPRYTAPRYARPRYAAPRYAAPRYGRTAVPHRRYVQPPRYSRRPPFHARPRGYTRPPHRR